MSRERERFDEIGKKVKRESDAFPGTGIGGRRYIQLGPPGTLNTITPCAACKLLRRRCAQECPFFPYFSPHEPQKFASVHKVFGASNVSKLLMEVPENQRADAANSLVFEANIRLRDPIYGCMGAISALQQEIQVLQAELNAVRAELIKHKYREVNLNLVSNNNNVINNITPATTTNNNNPSSHHNNLAFFVSGGASISIAVPPPPLTPAVPPPPPSPLPHGTHNIPPSSSISSSMYSQGQPSSSTSDQHNNDHYSSISNENIYFD